MTNFTASRIETDINKMFSILLFSEFIRLKKEQYLNFTLSTKDGRTDVYILNWQMKNDEFEQYGKQQVNLSVEYPNNNKYWGTNISFISRYQLITLQAKTSTS